MTPPLAALLLLAPLALDLPPGELIRRLDSDDRVVREEAGRTLAEQGAESLELLRAAHDAATEPAARERLARVIRQVETALLDRPTMVTLGLAEKPLPDAVAALAKSSGFAVALDARPPADPAFGERVVSLRTDRPLPFWEALDLLGRAGHVRHDPSHKAEGAGPSVTLTDGDPPAADFTAYHGPLRLHLLALHRQSSRTFSGPQVQPGNAPAGPQPGDPPGQPRAVTVTPNMTRTAAPGVSIDLQAFPEPGRFVDPRGEPRVEAVDAEGRTLPPLPPGQARRPAAPAQRRYVPGEAPLAQWTLRISAPEKPGGTLRELRGTLPVTISAREPNPLVIPLNEDVQKSYRQGSTTYQVTSPPRRPTITLRLRDDDPSGDSDDDPTDLLTRRLEVEDEQGRPMPWSTSVNTYAGPGQPGGVQLQIFASGTGGFPARIKLYTLRRLSVDVPFSFAGVPLP
jgi:hypothetical protein